jgi:hypothetical protein
VLTAIGVDPLGKRHVLGVSVAISEAGVHSLLCVAKPRFAEHGARLSRKPG